MAKARLTELMGQWRAHNQLQETLRAQAQAELDIAAPIPWESDLDTARFLETMTQVLRSNLLMQHAILQETVKQIFTSRADRVSRYHKQVIGLASSVGMTLRTTGKHRLKTNRSPKAPFPLTQRKSRKPAASRTRAQTSLKHVSEDESLPEERGAKRTKPTLYPHAVPEPHSPVLEYEDISAEVDARLRAKRQKQQLPTTKRKRESLDSNASAGSGGGDAVSLVVRPKKRVRREAIPQRAEEPWTKGQVRARVISLERRCVGDRDKEIVAPKIAVKRRVAGDEDGGGLDLEMLKQKKRFKGEAD
ncbi:hypothetical protein B0A49_00099 [Cryomyces minteri]|uniref:Uncharacterized protein n=1 Tax=Cryomyces minteri TaxID=331657 RepID=A0A4U0Y1Y0_9PEZI|nr:hypothetical protein B0A49_00099 [Cryomyces minteri]